MSGYLVGRSPTGRDNAASVTDDGALKVDIGNATLSVTADGVEIKNDTGNPVPVSTDVQKGGGAITATTTRVTLATDGPGVLALSNIDADLGAPADAAATTDTGTFSIIAFIKRGLQNWTTLLARVPALQSGATPIGDNGASLTVDGKAYRAAVDITRPANTTAYTALDVLGTGTGDDAIITLSSIGPSGGFVIVQSIELVLGISAVPSGMSGFRLHFYNAKPAAAADNSVFDVGSADRGKYIGYVDLPTPVDLGSTCFTQIDFPGKLFKLDTGSTSLFCELQTIGGFTPAANSEVYSLRVKTLEAGL
jgi:hypothetical protein